MPTKPFIIAVFFKTFDHPMLKRRRLTKATKTHAAKKTAAKAVSTKRKRHLIWLILVLIIVPAALPARASVLDPLVKILLPFYQKITGNDSTETTAENTDRDEPLADNEPLTNNETLQDNEPLADSSAPDAPAVDIVFDDNGFDEDAFYEVSLPTPTTAATTITASNTAKSANDPRQMTPDLFVLLNAEFAASRDDMPTALKLYKSESLKRNAAAVFERALSLSLQLEPAEESLAFAKAWQAQNHDHVPVWFYVTHLALKAGDYATAVQNLKLILSYDPKADLSRIFSGIFPADPDAQRALFYALQSVDNDTNPSLSVLKAGLLTQMNEHAAALLYTEQAIRAEPKNLAFLTLKADMLLGKGQHKALQKFLKDAQKRTDGDTQKQLYLYQIRHLIDQGELMDAWKVLKQAHAAHADDAELTLLASLVALDTHQHDAANKLLNKLLALPHYAAQAHYYLGISHERRQNHAQAIAHYRKVDDPNLVLPATRKIVAYELAFDHVDAAIDLLVDLRNQHEMFATESYTLQADILLRLGKHTEAATLLKQAAENYPDDPSLLYASTQLMDDTRDYAAKLANANTLLEFDPENLHYQLLHARLTLMQHEDESARANIRRISQLRFDHPQYDSQLQLQALTLLARYALADGNYQEVIDKLQTPYDVAPKLDIGALLLRAYQGLGDEDSVRELLADLQARFGTDADGSDINGLIQDY